MFFRKNKEQELRKEIERLQGIERALEDRVEKLHQASANNNKQMHNDNQNAEFVFDFKKMDAFSIERVYDQQENRWKTIVGYLLPGAEGVVKEWYYHCSIERHNELAAAFAKHLESKKK